MKHFLWPAAPPGYNLQLITLIWGLAAITHWLGADHTCQSRGDSGIHWVVNCRCQIWLERIRRRRECLTENLLEVKLTHSNSNCVVFSGQQGQITNFDEIQNSSTEGSALSPDIKKVVDLSAVSDSSWLFSCELQRRKRVYITNIVSMSWWTFPSAWWCNSESSLVKRK